MGACAINTCARHLLLHCMQALPYKTYNLLCKLFQSTCSITAFFLELALLPLADLSHSAATHTHMPTHTQTHTHMPTLTLSTRVHTHTHTQRTHTHTQHTHTHTQHTHTHNTHTHTHTHASHVALFPGLLHLQFLIACSMQKRREKAWGISSHDPWHDCQMLSRLPSTAK